MWYNLLVQQEFLKEGTILAPHKSSLQSEIVGYWIEDKNYRLNFDVFLSKVEESVDANDTIYSKYWQDEKVIYLDGNKLIIDEVKPYGEISQVITQLDNETVSEIDIELFGGSANATAAMSNEAITFYVLKPNSTELLLTISYSIESVNANVLHVKFKHIETNSVCTFLFRRQYIKDNDS